MALTMAKAVQRCATGVSARKPLETHREPYLTRSKTERIRKDQKYSTKNWIYEASRQGALTS